MRAIAAPRRSRVDRDALLERNMGIVYLCVYRARRSPAIRRWVSFEDAVQLALLVACRAAELFDESKGITFGAYVGRTIWNKLAQAVDEARGLPGNSSCRGLWGQELKFVSLTAFPAEPRGLRKLGQLPAPDEEAVRREVAALVRASLVHLTTRELQVVTLRYGLRGGECWTLSEVADAMGISKQRVQQLQEQALEKLRRVPELAHA